MAHAGAAAAATAGGVAVGAFGYNRGNYMYDAEFRWERFTSAREYANQQSEQYRGDIRNLAALTVKKNTLWATTSTLCMALCVALYCAGRLGLHGPSPPAWIMGLWLTNNAASFAFMALTTFLALHASFRANAASVHLLTRKTRVPVPTLKQLDEARRFASEFEQEGVSDILRIPYLSNHGAPRTDEASYDNEAGEGSDGRGRRGRRSTSAPPGGRSKCSSWIRDEFEGDRRGSEMASDLPEDAAPEHFRLYAAVQQEFYEYDIYARVGIFLGFIHYFQSLCFYGLGHINIELRAFYVAYGCTFVLAVLMALVLRFDIIPQSGRKQLLPKCEYFGPLAVLPAAIGMSLDFRVEYDPTAIALTWVFIFVAYIFQLIYALRILEVVLPDEKFEGLGERLGASWLPEGWNKVPSSFYHVLYAVAPPTKLQPGQHDIVREVKEGGHGASAEVLGSKAMSAVSEAPSGAHKVLPKPAFANNQVHPWKLMAAICAVLPCSWCFLIIGNIVDVAIGEQGLVTAPHWSRPPMSRQSLAPHELGTPIGFPWASGAKPFIPEQMAWHEEKRHADEYSIGRRLSATAPAAAAGELNDTVRDLLELVSGRGHAVHTEHRQASWPSFFEPRLLACGAGGHLAAVTARGFGAAVPPAGGAAEAFSLSGLTAAGPLISASWDAGHEGLLLASKHGGLFSCPGGRPAAGGVWSCMPASSHGFPSALPLAEGARLRAAATAVLKGVFHAALILEDEPELAALFAQEGGSWMPLGELRVPQGGSKGTSLSFMADGDLLVATGAGRVRRHSLLDGAAVADAVHEHNHRGEAAWQAACGLGDDRVAHLSLQKDSLGWQPTIATVEMLESKAKEAVFA